MREADSSLLLSSFIPSLNFELFLEITTGFSLHSNNSTQNQSRSEAQSLFLSPSSKFLQPSFHCLHLSFNTPLPPYVPSSSLSLLIDLLWRTRPLLPAQADGEPSPITDYPLSPFERLVFQEEDTEAHKYAIAKSKTIKKSLSQDEKLKKDKADGDEKRIIDNFPDIKSEAFHWSGEVHFRPQHPILYTDLLEKNEGKSSVDYFLDISDSVPDDFSASTAQTEETDDEWQSGSVVVIGGGSTDNSFNTSKSSEDSDLKKQTELSRRNEFFRVRLGLAGNYGMNNPPLPDFIKYIILPHIPFFVQSMCNDLIYLCKAHSNYPYAQALLCDLNGETEKAKKLWESEDELEFDASSYSHSLPDSIPNDSLTQHKQHLGQCL